MTKLFNTFAARWVHPPRLLFVLTAALLVPAAGDAQDTLATVFGTVATEDGERLAGARVLLVGAGFEITTDAEGTFRFNDVPAGTYTLEVRVIGMPPTEAQIVVRAGERFEAEVVIPAQPPVLPEVVVEAERRRLPRYMQEFYERSRMGGGFFITREDLEKRNPAVLSNVFRTVPRVRVTRNRANRYELSVVGTSCMRYWLNGALYQPGPLGIDEFSPDQIEGIEIYRSAAETPSRFNFRGEGCGVVVIWTRI